MPATRPELTADDYVEGVLANDRALLSRTITLLESKAPHHQALAAQVLDRLLPHTGQAIRVGITGAPGVGKSTLIEALGKQIIARGDRVAVLAIDPTSQVSGGSILGDKTRMASLAADPQAFIRPSPSAGALGGVARRTREAMLCCEAAGYDVVLVETVGVGQSEQEAADIVDCFLVLLLPGAGDELQGIKRGVLELADLLVVTKADGDNTQRAQRAAAEYKAALRHLRPRTPAWTPTLVTLSAVTGEGLDELWTQVEAHRAALTAGGEWDARRRKQQVRWMWRLVEDGLKAHLEEHPTVRSILKTTEEAVEAGRLTPGSAAQQILTAFRQHGGGEGGA